jgi:putative redox protein
VCGLPAIVLILNYGVKEQTWPSECTPYSESEHLMEVRIRHAKHKQSDAFSRFHRVVCDQPFDEGGADGGMTPPELMLAALGCCAMHYVVEYLRARHLAPGDIELRVSAEKGGRPLRLTAIGIEIDAPGLGMRAREGLLKAVDACLLHQTLANPPKIDIRMSTTVVEGPLEAERGRATSSDASGW